MVFSVSLYGMVEVHNLQLRRRGNNLTVAYPATRNGGKPLTMRPNVLNDITDQARRLYKSVIDGQESDSPYHYYWIEDHAAEYDQ